MAATGVVCSQCGHENRHGARFCDSCGARLTGDPDSLVEERKVVTVLFCDLVGFTAGSHDADPEDVSRRLAVYHAAARRAIERFGGVLEKFIGDAVVGVWGAPVVHEDDAERALRAALAIIEAVEPDVRIAVNTGEALVRLDSAADPGFGVVGDVVNTASRLQSVAPIGGAVAGEGTVRAARGAIEFVELEPARVKGKPEPVRVWCVVGIGAHAERSPATDTPFVGREAELGLLAGLYHRAVSEPGLQLVSLVGEPGVGKSRLVIEFESWLAGRALQPVVQRGRCLAYGDGVGYWPLAEIVKAQAGIAERDSLHEAERKLGTLVAGMPDASWLRARLGPLVGLPGEASDREQVFTAWRRFFDELAVRSALVVIIEDIHWADPAMLAFLRYLAEWSSDAPILVICTARPELLDANAGWGGDLVNASTIAVRPLKAADTQRLADLVLSRFPGEVESRVLVERCGGNPLYAEEYARLLAERFAGTEPAMPDSLHALIAARIDTLTPERKVLLQEAAVVGKTFWAGAIESIRSPSTVDVRAALHELVRKELIRAVRVSSVPGDDEYVFWHDLVHHVAYRGIPRARRADLHAKTAAWIEQLAGDRVADRAELLAHHYGEALRFAFQSGIKIDDREYLRERTLHYLAMAAERAVGLDTDQAERLVADGLQLATGGDAEYARLLCQSGACEFLRGRYAEARNVLFRARDAAETHGDFRTIGEALNLAFAAVWFMGDGDGAYETIHSAVRRLRPEAPTDQLAVALAWAGCLEVLRENWGEARALCGEALSVAEQVGDAFAIASAKEWRGMLRVFTGESDGADDLEAASEIFTNLGSSMAAQGRHQLAGSALMWHGPEPARALYEEAADYAHRTGSTTWEMQARGESTWSLFDSGAWDDVLRVADTVAEWEATVGPAYPSLFAVPQQAHVLALRGDVPVARAALAAVLDRSRSVRDPQVVAPTLAIAAVVEWLDGYSDRALQLIDELGSASRSPHAPLTQMCRVLLRCGALEATHRLRAAVTGCPPRSQHALCTIDAMLAEYEGSASAAARLYDDAVDRWRTFGNPFELAQALAGRARMRGHGDDGAAAAAETRAIFGRLGVSRAAQILGVFDRA